MQNRTYGTPAFIGGEFQVRAPATDAVAVARGFLNAQRSTIGINDPNTELRVVSVVGPDEVGMSHVKFAHFAKGIPVFGSELIVHMKGDVVTSMNGTYLPSIRQAAEVRVQGDDAAALAIDTMRDMVNMDRANPDVAGRLVSLDLDDSPTLVFFNQGLITDQRTPTVLAWKVSVNSYLFFIDATTGRVVDAWDNVHQGLSRKIYDSKHTTNLQVQLVCSGSSCSSSDTDTMNAWDQFEATYNYFSSTHDRDSWDDQGGVLIGNVHYSTNYENAYWDGSQMVFGDGFVCEDVTAHELGHGVCQATANLTYKSQSGALNEHYSDVWGVSVDNGDWLVGEDLPIGAIRSFENPEEYGQPKDMDGYKKYIFYDNGGVHINSGIPNYGFYLIADGGSNDGVTVVGQGRDKAEQVWYRAETTKLTSSSKFSDFSKAIVAACGELYGGSSSSTCQQFSNGMKAIGL